MTIKLFSEKLSETYNEMSQREKFSEWVWNLPILTELGDCLQIDDQQAYYYISPPKSGEITLGKMGSVSLYLHHILLNNYLEAHRMKKIWHEGWEKTHLTYLNFYEACVLRAVLKMGWEPIIGEWESSDSSGFNLYGWIMRDPTYPDYEIQVHIRRINY